MNRVLGDYFEVLMYKIFVSIDEHTNIAEVRLSFNFFISIIYYIFFALIKEAVIP